MGQTVYALPDSFALYDALTYLTVLAFVNYGNFQTTGVQDQQG